MDLLKISLKNFRNHSDCTFTLSHTTVIVGKNTAGKTNIIEAVYFLSHGKSFRSGKDIDAIEEGKEFARIEGVGVEDNAKTNFSIQLIKKDHFAKRFFVNDIAKRQHDFTSHLNTTLFEPSDLEALTSSPSKRRAYIDSILSQTDKKYRLTLSTYEKALRHRNKMLHLIKEGKKFATPEEFDYWNNVLITNGHYITSQREQYLQYLNSSKKTTFPFSVSYDKSIMSQERLDSYFEIEQKVGVTLVGPQRDDFLFFFENTEKPIAEFGSRGEQRLTILQMKLLEIDYIHTMSQTLPILLLDDIFSELDSKNIEKIIPLIFQCQTIITTTHKEFIPKDFLSKIAIIELE